MYEYAIGQILNRKELYFLSNQLTISSHAKKRIKERLGFYKLEFVRELIKNSNFAFVNEEDSAIVTIDEERGSYFVVGIKSMKVITVVINPSDYSIKEIWLRAMNGHKRKNNRKRG